MDEGYAYAGVVVHPVQIFLAAFAIANKALAVALRIVVFSPAHVRGLFF